MMTSRTTARQYARYLVRVRDLIRKADAEHGHGHGVCRVCGCTEHAGLQGRLRVGGDRLVQQVRLMSGNVDRLCWMISQLAATRGYCPRGPLRVMYQDLFGDDVLRSSRKAGSNGKYSSLKLGEDLRALEKLGIIERCDVRVIVTDRDRLRVMAGVRP